MKDEGGQKSGGVAGGLCGCLAALVLVAPFVVPLLFSWAWGWAHCGPVPQCQREGDVRFALLGAGVLALGALFGFAVRTIVRWWGHRIQDPEGAGWPPVWAVAVAALLGAAALWMLGETWMLY